MPTWECRSDFTYEGMFQLKLEVLLAEEDKKGQGPHMQRQDYDGLVGNAKEFEVYHVEIRSNQKCNYRSHRLFGGKWVIIWGKWLTAVP